MLCKECKIVYYREGGKQFMKKFSARCLALFLAAAMTATGLTACNKTIKGEGGTPLDQVKEDAYDFTTAWVTERSDLKTIDDETWRLGTFGGSSVKVTSGSTAGIGAWYDKELPDSWVINMGFSFKNADAGAVSAGAYFGPDKDTASLTLAAERDDKDQVRFSLKKGDAALVSTGWVKPGKNTEYSCILDNNGGDGKLKLYITGDDKFSYAVQTDDLSDVLPSVKTFAFYADKNGVTFDKIAVDIMLYKPGVLLEFANAAIDDLLANFWDEDQGKFIDCSDDMVWEYGMAMLALETMYDTTGDQKYKDLIASEWAFMQTRFTDEAIAKAGVAPNIAADDAAWNAMTLMVIYRATGDQHALKLAGDVVRNSYEYWKDGEVANGLWYRIDDGKPADNIKSLYSTGLVLTALEYHEATKGTDLADPDLYTDTIALYNWIEKYLRRDGIKTYGDMVVEANDNLYFCDFVEKGSDSRPYGPAGGNQQGGIGEAGSCSALFGNMGMAAVNAKLFAMTGEAQYRDKALDTANSLATSIYGTSGVLLNDRDAWTNATFVRYWVKDVLTLDGIEPKNMDLIKNTGLSIALKCRTEEGFYRAEWSGGLKWSGGETKPEQIMTTATSIHMICAGALAEKMGLIEAK